MRQRWVMERVVCVVGESLVSHSPTILAVSIRTSVISTGALPDPSPTQELQTHRKNLGTSISRETTTWPGGFCWGALDTIQDGKTKTRQSPTMLFVSGTEKGDDWSHEDDIQSFGVFPECRSFGELLSDGRVVSENAHVVWVSPMFCSAAFLLAAGRSVRT